MGDTKDLVVAELMMKAHLAKREMPKVGDEDHPTPWDLEHRRIDELLTKWEREHEAHQGSVASVPQP